MSIMDYVKEYIESSGNGKWCEDKVLISKSILGVLDGATPIDIIEIGSHHTQACWFVNEFFEFFSQKKAEPVNSIECFCKELIGQIDASRLFGCQDYNYPCCTAAFVRLDNNILLVNILGDCNVYVSLKNKSILHLYDNRVDSFSRRTRIISQQRFGDVFEKENAIREQKIINRKQLNKPDGFYALTLNNDWLGSFVEHQLCLEAVESVLVCSDGFARLFNEYQILNPQTFFDEKMTLVNSLALIRDFEKSNALVNNCVKSSDDVSAILLYF